MYTQEAIESMARLHGWDGGERTLPLYLPFGVLRSLDEQHPYRKAVTIASRKLDVHHSVMTWLFTNELDRAFSDIVVERIYADPPQQEEPQAQPVEKGKSSEYSDEDGDGEPSELPPPPNGTPKKYTDGEGNQPGNQSPPPQAQPRAGQSPKTQQRALNKWLKSQKQDQQQKNKEQQQGQMTPTHGFGGTGTNSVGDPKIANRLRALFDQIVGAFDQEPTPLWDASKIVKRTLSHMPLDPARKWEDGRPGIAFMTDTSGSCRAMSAAMTLAANSASLLGTTQGKIYSFPFSNSTLDHNDKGYVNGEELQALGNGTALQALNAKFKHTGMEKMVGGNAANILSEVGGIGYKEAERMVKGQVGRSIYTLASTALLANELGVKLSSSTPTYQPFGCTLNEMLDNMNIDADQKAGARQRFSRSAVAQGHLRRMQELGMGKLIPSGTDEELLAAAVKIDELSWNARKALMTEILGASNPWRDETWAGNGGGVNGSFCSEQGNMVNRDMADQYQMDEAMLAAMDVQYYVYYTDNDGLHCIRHLAGLLRPEQHLYVLTYGYIPTHKVDSKTLARAEGSSGADLKYVQDELTRSDGWVVAARNTWGFHTAKGNYGYPATVSKKDTIGISVPMYAYTPKHYGDMQWLPTWFNGYSWDSIMGSKGMEQVTVIPNVDSIDGSIEAMRFIASPDRMRMAVEGGYKIRQQLEKEGRWGTWTTPLGSADGLYRTPYDVKN